MKPVHVALARLQTRLTIDGDRARGVIQSLPPESNPYDIQGMLVRDIEESDFRVSVGRFGRLSNNITSMKREVRAALSVGEEPLRQVDISCSQPALLGRIAMQRNRTKTAATTPQHPVPTMMPHFERQERREGDQLASPKADLKDYCELVQSGQFYDFMLAQLKTGPSPDFTRQQIKERFLTDVVAKRKLNERGDEYSSCVEDVFRRRFPSVYRFVRETNKDGWEHANLIRRLQQEESRLVIETVAANLVAQHPELFVLTLHDAIYTTANGIPVVLNAFEAAFRNAGYPMWLKVA
jgi:hypothetical protein